MGGREEKERKKEVLAECYLLGLPFRNPPTSLRCLFLFPVYFTIHSKKFLVPTPFCVETTELHLNSDVLLQVSG